MTQRVAICAALCLALLAPARALADAGDDQYAVAAAHYSQGRWQLAVEEFEALLRRHPDHPRAAKSTFFLAEALMQLGRYGQARERFDQFLVRDAKSVYRRQALFRAGEASYFAGKAADARVALARFQEYHPDDELHAYTLTYLGDLAANDGNLDDAATAYAKCVEKFPSGPLLEDCRLGLAKAFIGQKQHAKAAEQLELLTSSKNAALVDEAHFQIGLNALGAGDVARAISELSPLVENKDEKLAAKARLVCGQALQQSGKPSEARTMLTPLGEHLEHGAEAQLWIGLTRKSDGEFAVAAKDLLAAAERYSKHRLSPVLKYHAADSLVRQGNYAEARELLAQDGVGDASQQVNRKYLLAIALQGDKQHAAAIKVLDDLMPTAPKELETSILAARAQSLVTLERYQDAAAALEKLITAQDQAVARPMADLAVCQARQKEWDAARASFSKLAERHPTDASTSSVAVYLANLARDGGQEAWARELLGRAAKSEATDAATGEALVRLGWSQLREARDAKTAAATLGTFLERFPKHRLAGDALLLHAEALEASDQTDEALMAYAKRFDLAAADPGDDANAGTALLGLARLHVKLKQHREAVKRFEQYLLLPNKAEEDAALYTLAFSLLEVGRQDDAHKTFAHLHKNFANSRYWGDVTLRLAHQAFAAKDLTAANELATAVVTREGKDVLTEHALYLQSQIAVAAGRWDAVASPLEKLTTDHPESALRLPAEYWLAESLYRQGKLTEAGPKFDALAKAAEGRNELWLATIPLRQAQLLAQSREWDAARRLAETIEKRFPGFAQQFEVDYLIGRCHASQAEFDQARDAYLKVIRSQTGGKSETAAMAQWMMGETLFHQKEYQAAVREYLRVEILYSYPHWQAAGLLQAGKCYEALDQWKTAADTYSKLLKTYPNSDFTEEATQRLQAATKQLAAK